MTAARPLRFWEGKGRPAQGFPWLDHKTCAFFEGLERDAAERREASRAYHRQYRADRKVRA